MKRFLVFLLIMVLSTAAGASGKRIVIDDFENGLNPLWEAKKFVKETIYTVQNTEGGKALKAESNASASSLIYRISYDPVEFPYLSWRWKVENIIKKGDATRKERDDFPARVYVIFSHWIPFKRKSLGYIWANRLPEGSNVTSTYYGRLELIAVKSGSDKTGRWISETRNVYEDYKKLFGAEPPMVEGIAVMTDSDNTGESATTWYDDIVVSSEIK